MGHFACKQTNTYLYLHSAFYTWSAVRSLHCVIPEYIHASPTEGIFSKTPHPPGNSN